jgi:hypothetical protein
MTGPDRHVFARQISAAEVDLEAVSAAWRTLSGFDVTGPPGPQISPRRRPDTRGSGTVASLMGTAESFQIS